MSCPGIEELAGDEHSCGSEGGDDWHFTQPENDDSSHSDDDDVPLMSLVSKDAVTRQDDDSSDNDDDERPLISLIGKENSSAPPSVVLQGTATSDPSLCPICGLQLATLHSNGLKSRLDHLKRCARKHGIEAKDIALDQEEEEQLLHHHHGNNHKNSPVVDLTSDVPSTGSSLETRPSVHDVLMANARRGSSQMVEKPTVNSVLMVGAKRAAKNEKEQQKNTGKKRRWNQGWQRYTNRECPFYKKIPGTDFVCDGFQYARKTLTENYFLTHFHSDHYGGISRKWNAGTIYCSQATANLVHQQLGVDRQYLHPLPMNKSILLHSQGNPVTVYLLDANHCPGAVMFLFHVGKRWILHVGDFRWDHSKMMQLEVLRPFLTGSMRLDDIFLDTTYCNPKYVLPSQEDAIAATVEKAVAEVQAANRARQRLLMLFGAYTIGKERIYLAVAERLDMKVYVDSRRFRILSALDWPRSTMARFTTRPEETLLWVVPLGHINMKKLPTYLSVQVGTYSRVFDRLVGFRPTGWSLSTKGSGIVKGNQRGKLTVYSVPYSEHSSFPELAQCVACLRPKRIIPTVSVSKSEVQVKMIMENLPVT